MYWIKKGLGKVTVFSYCQPILFMFCYKGKADVDKKLYKNQKKMQSDL